MDEVEQRTERDRPYSGEAIADDTMIPSIRTLTRPGPHELAHEGQVYDHKHHCNNIDDQNIAAYEMK